MRILIFILFPFILSAQNADWKELQGKIDTAIKYGSKVWIDRNYEIDKPLIAAVWNGTAYGQVYFQMEGQGSMWDNGRVSVIKATFTDAPIFSIQRGKGVIIRGVSFISNKIGRDSRFSPQAAICIDPFSGLLPADSGYPTLREWYRGGQTRSGSTGCRFEDITTGGTTVGIIISPNGYTQNGEMMTFQNIRFGVHKYGFAGCQAQEKMNRIINVGAWSDMICLFQFNTYGAQQPGNYIIDGVNIAGSVKNIIYRWSGGWGPMYITNVFAESVESIGIWDGQSGDCLSNALINFKYKNETGYITDLNLDGRDLTIKNSNIRYYGEVNQPIILRGIKDGGGNSFYLPPVTDTYGWETGKKFRISQPFDFPKDTVINHTSTAKIKYPYWKDSCKVGDFVIFMQPANWIYQGQGQIIAKDSLNVTIGFISPNITTLSNQRIGIYKKL